MLNEKTPSFRPFYTVKRIFISFFFVLLLTVFFFRMVILYIWSSSVDFSLFDLETFHFEYSLLILITGIFLLLHSDKNNQKIQYEKDSFAFVYTWKRITLSIFLMMLLAFSSCPFALGFLNGDFFFLSTIFLKSNFLEEGIAFLFAILIAYLLKVERLEQMYHFELKEERVLKEKELTQSIEELDQVDEATRATIILELGNHKIKEAIPKIGELLQDPSWLVRYNAKKALINLLGEEAFLEKFGECDTTEAPAGEPT